MVQSGTPLADPETADAVLPPRTAARAATQPARAAIDPPTTRPVVVIGSINMDLVCRVPSMPAPGQTLLGSDFVTIPGGKGANQAVAAAKLSKPREQGGTNVYLVGRLGDDDFGERLLNGLNRHNVRTDYVTITEGAPSGVAMILVDGRGENSIVAVPGANARLRPADVDAARQVIAGAAAVVLQLEIPEETIDYAIALCQKLGIPVILDPAPAYPQGLPASFYNVDIFTPNQSEAELLAGLAQTFSVSTKRLADPKLIGIELVSRGAKQVVLKLGADGAMIVGSDGQIRHVEPFKVDVVDTTAAGDAFTAALAVARAEGMELPEAVRFANAAGALCCETFGAQPSLPTRERVEALLATEGG